MPGSRKNAPRTKAVTLQDIADHLGLARATVSRALSGNRQRISLQTVERVTRAAAELGYDPSFHQDARRLVMRRSNMPMRHQLVALIVPPLFLEATYYLDQAYSAMETLDEAGYVSACIPAFLSKSTTPVSTLATVFSRGGIDGILLLDCSPDMERLLLSYKERGYLHQYPIVTLLDYSEHFSAVLIDDKLGGMLAAGHLLDLGHRHIAHCFALPDSTYHAQQRVAGYRQAFIERGLDPEVYLHAIPIPLPRDDFWEYRQAERFVQMRREDPRITAVLAMNDGIAFIFHEVLTRAGLAIPGDVSLVGFDDAEPTPRAPHENILTTIHVPLVDVGQRGARLLLNMIATGERTPTSETLPISLVARATTAPPRPRAC